VHLNASASGGAFVVAQRLNEQLNSLPNVSSQHLVFTGQSSTEYTLWSNTWMRKKWAFLLHALEKLDFIRFEKNKSVRFQYSHALTGINVLKNPLVKDADVIHLHWINKGFINLKGLAELLKSGKKIVWTAHDMWPFTGGCYYSGDCTNYTSGCIDCKFLKNSEIQLSSKMLTNKAELLSQNKVSFISPSNWLLKIAKKSMTFLDVNHLCNGLDLNVFRPIIKIQEETNGLFVVGFSAANLNDTRKGMADFIQMIPILKSVIPNLKIIFIGTKKEELKLPPDVNSVFSGYISDESKMVNYLNTFNVFITTSHEDNLPTTIMESLACGVPVFAYRSGGIPEMVNDQIGGSAEKFDFIALCDKVIEYYYSENSYKEKIKENARNFAIQNYDIKKIAKRHLEIYNNA